MGSLALVPDAQELLAQTRAALADRHAALDDVHPAVTWQQPDWKKHTRALREQLDSGRLPRLLRRLADSPLLDVIEQPAEHLDWILDVRSAVEHVRVDALPDFTAWLAELLSPQLDLGAFAASSSRWHLVRDRLQDHLNTLLVLLQQPPASPQQGVRRP